MTTRKRPLKVGLIVTDIEDPQSKRIYAWAEINALVQSAEAAGFDSAWIPDHLIHEPPGVPRYGIWEAWSLISALCAVTSSIKIGPHVLCSSWRNPALIAKMADTVDEISNGRLILALGAGWHEPEYRAFGFPFDHRIGRFDEAVQIIHGLLRNDRMTLNGDYYQVADCELRPRGPSRGGPPIMIGTIAGTPLGDVMGLERRGNRMLDLVARYADIWNCPTINDPVLVPPIRQMIDEACERNGRDPASLLRSHGMGVNLPGWQDHPGLPTVRKRRAEAGVFNGDIPAIAAHLQAFADQGVDEVHVQLDPESPAGIEQFAKVLEILDS